MPAGTSGVRLGLSIFGHPPEHVVRIAAVAEQLGFDRLSVGDHLMSPLGYESRHPYRPQHDADERVVPPSWDLSDPFASCAGIGVATSTLRVATGVVIAPLYHPLHLARSTISVQRLCSGRFELGVGVGWLREEFTAVGANFERRGRALDEALEIVGDAFRGGPFDHHGECYDFDQVSITPQPTPTPLIIGGTTRPAMRRAARYGDGYYCPSAVDFDAYNRMREQIDAFRQQFGRLDRAFRYYVRLDEPDPDLVATYTAAGFHDLTLGSAEVWPDPTLALDDKLQRLTDLAARFGLAPADQGRPD